MALKGIYKRYTIIPRGLSSDFAHDKRYRYKGVSFITKRAANKYFNKLAYEQQRNQAVVMYTIRY